ncbi:MAG: TonB-dependent receptor, partial [Bacteroidales bacterium]|nr:TonB-dependent receptor [Bacteroidales bacterium]
VQGDARYGRLKFSLGVRFEYFKVDTSMTKTELRFGKDTINIPIKPVARLGVNYQVAEATFLRASFGQGYRFPAVSEKFISMALGAVKVFPNNNLNPETSWSVEVGAKQGYKFGKWKGFADAAVYFQRMYNMMEFGFVVLNSLTGEPYELGQVGDPEMGFQCANVGNADIFGVDLSGVITGPLGNWGELNAMVGYTYNNPKYISDDIDPSTSTDDKTLKYRYKHSVKADVSLTAKWFEVGFDLVWKSKVKNVDRLFCDERPEDEIIGDYAVLSSLVLPGYWDYRIRTAGQNFWNIDFYVGAKLYKETKISFHIKNLLNQVYCGRPGDICAPRRFEVSLSAKF